MIKKILHAFLLSVAFSVILWLFINKYIIEIGYWKYVFMEILVLSGGKLYGYILDKVMRDETTNNNAKDQSGQYIR